ncbi:preprotein translocase [uncultured archaeon]|nr:preprotein translocase [uncultured archaeon]
MSFDEKAMEIQDKVERRFSNLGKGKYSRLLRMAKKPDRDEYIKVLLITGAGIILLGLLGFFIYLMMGYYFKIP